VVTTGAVSKVPAAKVEKVVDTTGAGDLFAAGFLFGITHDLSPRESARIGGVAAAEIISHFGARPEKNLSALIA
jgi:sugar/nucleoside kinase (ribokinase family)